MDGGEWEEFGFEADSLKLLLPLVNYKRFLPFQPSQVKLCQRPVQLRELVVEEGGIRDVVDCAVEIQNLAESLCLVQPQDHVRLAVIRASSCLRQSHIFLLELLLDMSFHLTQIPHHFFASLS